MFMMCPAWTRPYTKEPPDCLVSWGPEYSWRVSIILPDTVLGRAHRWKPWISMNKSAGRGSWGCWRLSSICLNQEQKKRQPRGPNRVSQDPNIGWMWQVIDTAPSHTLLPEQRVLCWETNSDQWSLEFKILILQETENIWVREQGTLQSETRWWKLYLRRYSMWQKVLRRQ